MLHSIQYPSGGKTEFTYTLNEYYSYENRKYIVRKGGGLRVSEIKNFDFNNQLISHKKYLYEAEKIDNNIHKITNFIDSRFTIYSERPEISVMDDMFIYRTTHYTDRPSGSLGNHMIKYSQVSELSIGEKNSENGKNIFYYEYKNPNQFTGFSSSEKDDKAFLLTKEDWNNGQLVKIETYEKNKNQLILRKKEERKTQNQKNI